MTAPSPGPEARHHDVGPARAGASLHDQRRQADEDAHRDLGTGSLGHSTQGHSGARCERHSLHGAERSLEQLREVRLRRPRRHASLRSLLYRRHGADDDRRAACARAQRGRGMGEDHRRRRDHAARQRNSPLAGQHRLPGAAEWPDRPRGHQHQRQRPVLAVLRRGSTRTPRRVRLRQPTRRAEAERQPPADVVAGAAIPPLAIRSCARRSPASRCRGRHAPTEGATPLRLG